MNSRTFAEVKDKMEESYLTPLKNRLLHNETPLVSGRAGYVECQTVANNAIQHNDYSKELY